MTKLYGGRTNYGESIGILMLDTRFPRIPGDVGNATTFDFPVRYEIVTGASPDRVYDEGTNTTMLECFIEAARRLERAGVRAVTTSCGFLALYQKEIADSLSVPFFSSSLIQAKIASQIIGKDKKVGILTAEAASMGMDHFRAVGIDDVPLTIIGMDETPEFFSAFVRGGDSFDPDIVRIELFEAAERMKGRYPDVGAVILECTNMSPYAKVIQDVLKIPVFDITTLINFVHMVVCRREFTGIL